MNALTVDMALGCSTNSMLHLPAIAHEAGVELNVDIANEVSARTPNLCHLAPAGPTYMEDLNEAGGVYAVMKELTQEESSEPGLHDCDRKDRRREYRRQRQPQPGSYPPHGQSLQHRPAAWPFLKGNLAPDSGVVKRSAVVPEMMKHEGPARVFDCEEDAIAAINGRQDRGRGCGCHPLRGTERRPGHERDAESDLRDCRYGTWFQRGPHHRRPFLRSFQRSLHRPCVPGGSCGRPHRSGGGGRYHLHRYSRATSWNVQGLR